MAAATRFVIDDAAAPEPQRPSVVSAAERATRYLPWIEFAVLVPSKLLGVLGWLAIPLLVFAIVPVVLLGTLLIAQAPVFFLLWKLFGSNQPLVEEISPSDFGRDKLAS